MCKHCTSYVLSHLHSSGKLVYSPSCQYRSVPIKPQHGASVFFWHFHSPSGSGVAGGATPSCSSRIQLEKFFGVCSPQIVCLCSWQMTLLQFGLHIGVDIFSRRHQTSHISPADLSETQKTVYSEMSRLLGKIQSMCLTNPLHGYCYIIWDQLILDKTTTTHVFSITWPNQQKSSRTYISLY